MSLYQNILRPILFKTDPEWIHEFALHSLAHTPLASLLTLGQSVPTKPVQLWNLTFRNPLGLAAGFDKNGVAVAAFEKLGFGFMEVGTVTPIAQPGNPKPRMFRCPQEKGLINRMGFNNYGVDALEKNLMSYHSKNKVRNFPLGINIGKGKNTPLEEATNDYITSFKKLYDLGDFFVVNVSSPNTPNLRTLQQPEQLAPILKGLQEHNKSSKPLLLKIAPDLHYDDVEAILGVVHQHNLSGVVATNTTIDHSAVKIQQQGGLSGAPVRQKSTEMIRFLRQRTQLPIIGVGGVFTKADFQEKLDAGANLVQVYTGFIYQGPWIAHEILK